MFSPLFFSIFSSPNPLPSKYLSASLLIMAPGADPGSVGSLTPQQPSGDERLGAVWRGGEGLPPLEQGFESSLEEHLPNSRLGAALPGN